MTHRESRTSTPHLIGAWMIVSAMVAAVPGCGSGDDCDDPFTDAVETCSGNGEGPGGEGGPGATTSTCSTPALTEDYLTNCGSATWYIYDGTGNCLIGGPWRFSPGGNLSVDNNCTSETLNFSYTVDDISEDRMRLGTDELARS